MTLTQSRGWQLTLIHPDTGRTVSLDVLDNPEFSPSLNGLVEARIPIRRSQDLLEWPDGTTVSLSLNGNTRPLDEVVDIEQQSDRTIVVAEGAIELENRVRTEYRKERRHIAAEEIINNQTPYNTKVDTPEFEIQNGVILQNPDTTQEFADILQLDDTEPIEIANGEVKTLQSAFFGEAENNNPSQIISDGSYSGGQASLDLGTVGDKLISYSFTTQYDWTANNWGVAVREDKQTDDGTGNVYSVFVDGQEVGFSNSANLLNWEQRTADFNLPAGSHTLVVELTQVRDDQAIVDIAGAYDTRFDYTFDNEVNEPSGYLDGPEEKPNAVDVVFNDATTPFVITEATANLTIDETTNGQAVALSADRGDTYTEVQNSDTVTATGLETTQVRLRVTLSRYSPQGPRDETPRLGYASQSLDSFEIRADIRQESLLIDQTFDDSVSSVLNQIAGDEYIWSYRLENGTPTIAWTQPGQRTADSDPDIDASVSVSKNVKTWDAVTIKGSAQSASGEEFNGSTSFVDLVRDNIVPGSEAVRGTSNGIQFTRSEDYEMQYNPGEIRILDSGDMSAGTTYEIDYRYEVEGQFPEDYAGSGRELVETISGVVSDRQAQQLAYTILEIDPGVADPSWSADVLLPRGDELFDPLEALSLEQLELPDAATPLEVREPPQQTPQGIALQLGSRRGLDEALSSLSTQLKSVSRRS